jgi:hypothetical protein
MSIIHSSLSLSPSLSDLSLHHSPHLSPILNVLTPSLPLLSLSPPPSLLPSLSHLLRLNRSLPLNATSMYDQQYRHREMKKDTETLTEILTSLSSPAIFQSKP